MAIIHLFANQAKLLGWIWHNRFLSFASGISFAYVFVDLLPTLEKGQPIIKQTLDPLIPFLDRHAYVIALLGVLFYYGVHTRSLLSSRQLFALSGYLIFNFLLGASLSDINNPDIQPLVLFTIGMGLHYFVRDHNLGMDDLTVYEHFGRWLLILALFAGYFVGYMTHIPDALVAISVSFLAGGVLLNVFRYELPKREIIGYAYFVAGALIYTAIILSIGRNHN